MAEIRFRVLFGGVAMVAAGLSFFLAWDKCVLWAPLTTNPCLSSALFVAGAFGVLSGMFIYRGKSFSLAAVGLLFLATAPMIGFIQSFNFGIYTPSWWDLTNGSYYSLLITCFALLSFLFVVANRHNFAKGVQRELVRFVPLAGACLVLGFFLPTLRVELMQPKIVFTPNCMLFIENAKEGNNEIVIKHIGGDTFYNAFDYDNAGPDNWRNLEVSLNDVVISGNFIIEATSGYKKLTATTSGVKLGTGDVIKVKLPATLKIGDNVVLIFKPNMEILLKWVVSM